ncbi:MAG: translation initiation factor IF-2 associated domain-containing protein, partial [Ectothiorhodospiraceae bacterium]|nr:translation initiation factor IF-2 associated domain-containing protein [Ectothiorhodospiraceae bacterium]
MSEVTVKQFAEAVGTPVERLLTQLKEAGVDIRDADAVLSDEDKATLLAYLRKSHGREGGASDVAEPRKITLRRKSVSQIKLGGTAGGRGSRGGGTPARTVNVEVRKKRTYVKRSVVEAEKERQEAEQLELQRQEETARQAEQAQQEMVEQGQAEPVAEQTEAPAAPAAPGQEPPPAAPGAAGAAA